MNVDIINKKIDLLLDRLSDIKSFYSFEKKKDKLAEVLMELGSDSVWSNPDKLSALNKDKSRLESFVTDIEEVDRILNDSRDLLEISESEDDVNVVTTELAKAESKIADFEFKKMFSGENAAADCYVDIQSGSGGTEAQDWANMLLRMYLRWCEKKSFAVDIIDISNGDVTGIKSATFKVSGEYAYGLLRTETGVHRLVRKSPFNATGKRHTSFASLFVFPEVDDSIDIDINPADLRIDVYRASGAGGQHVNKTESAVRITHIPTGCVVQCQNQRSQHKNKDIAMNQLRSKLYDLELQKKNKEKQDLESSKSDIGWGNQIRSYVLDDSRIKDLRTGFESRNTQAVLNGDLDAFIESSLKSGL